jgi:hypothetical protein
MKMKNWMTTIGGLLAGLPPIIQAVSPFLPPKYAAIASAVGVIILGISAKDFNKTGTTGL